MIDDYVMKIRVPESMTNCKKKEAIIWLIFKAISLILLNAVWANAIFNLTVNWFSGFKIRKLSAFSHLITFLKKNLLSSKTYSKMLLNAVFSAIIFFIRFLYSFFRACNILLSNCFKLFQIILNQSQYINLVPLLM